MRCFDTECMHKSLPMTFSLRLEVLLEPMKVRTPTKNWLFIMTSSFARTLMVEEIIEALYRNFR